MLYCIGNTIAVRCFAVRCHPEPARDLLYLYILRSFVPQDDKRGMLCCIGISLAVRFYAVYCHPEPARDLNLILSLNLSHKHSEILRSSG
jgi:hypothetical protein